MDGLSKKLTEKDVTEALSQRKELLECYRQRHPPCRAFLPT